MSEFKDCIRSIVPGRVRLRHPMIRTMTAEDRETARQWLMSIESVFGVDFNPAVGSALILWDAEKLSTDAFLEQLENLIMMAAGMMGGEAQGTEADGYTLARKALLAGDRLTQSASRGLGNVAVMIAGGPGKQHSVQRVKRMAVNRTMLASLILSMGGIALKNTGVHVAAGVTFLGLLGLHLLENRRLL